MPEAWGSRVCYNLLYMQPAQPSALDGTGFGGLLPTPFDKSGLVHTLTDGARRVSACDDAKLKAQVCRVRGSRAITPSFEAVGLTHGMGDNPEW